MALNDVQHFFVLMLENRSFDHIFGLSGISGISATTGQRVSVDGLIGKRFFVKNRSGELVQIDENINRALNRLTRDIPHELGDVKRQLCGPSHHGPYSDRNITMDGFIADRDGTDPTMEDAVRCVGPGHLRVLTSLAKEFVVCDRWFSSVPGPTFPNRMFAHAATSGGIADSPGHGQIALRTIDGYDFRNGHIFGRLRQKRIPWTIFVHDRVENMSVLLDGISAFGAEMKEFSQFAWELQKRPFLPRYVFIEPRYDAILSDFSRGNSMHPISDMMSAEALVKDVYEAIRASPHVWQRSALIIVFDEHGGFFDHVPPPAAPAPEDGSASGAFDFKRLGPRVPAVIISPLIPKNRVDSTVYDHTSILKTLALRFGLAHLTKRDASANALEHLFTLSSARRDTPERLPDPLAPSPRSRSIPEIAAGAGHVGAAVGPFVLAAAAVNAELEGPDAWDSIKDEVRSLDGRSQNEVAHYVTRVRSDASVTVGATAPRGTRSRGVDFGGMSDVSMFAARTEGFTRRDEVEERHAEAWRLGISQAELRAIEALRGEGGQDRHDDGTRVAQAGGDQGTSEAREEVG
ncbi:alkaline phosphatase family protein [Sorangium sp. So ce362]|uniref:alkaline phosphatase family protein n=1 Tax=Sorangium sp. So ce362 TaxID=3133303 RepID=UPI003F6412E4